MVRSELRWTRRDALERGMASFGRIVEILDIDLPRPRRLDKLPQRFNDYAGRIREIFKSKGVLAMD